MNYILDICDIEYRVRNEKTAGLPDTFRNLCVDIEPSDIDAADNDEKIDFLFRNAAGKEVMNLTGYTPENFNLYVKRL